jgi:tape measure domain-containing protein
MAEELLARSVLAMDVDGSQAVAAMDQLEAKVAKSEREIATKSGRMAEELAGIGSGAARGTAGVDRATQQLRASIERTTAALASGVKGSTAYFENLAKQRGANLDVLRPYIEQLSKVKSAQEEVARAAEEQAKKQREAAAAARQAEAAASTFISALEREANAIGKTRVELLRQEAALKGVSREAEGYIRKIEQTAQANDRLGGGVANLAGAIGRIQGLLAGAGIAVGAGAFIELGKSIVEARTKAESLEILFKSSLGGNAAREFEAVRGTAQRLGLEFQSTALSYAKFAAAARGTALEGEGARKVFESVARASVVFGLSAEQSEGALLALQQIVSKGTVQAEELRGQLGERLPGAFQIAARAMGVTTAELSKMLEQGLVPAVEFLPKFAKQLDTEVGGAAESAANRTAASVNRLVNAYEELKRVNSQGATGAFVQGAIDAAAKSLDAMSAAMKRAQAEGSGLYGQIAAGQLALLGFGSTAQSTAADLKKAETELARLQAGMKANPGDIILAQYTREAEQLVIQLRAAKTAQDALSGPAADPRDQSRFKSRSQSYADFDTASAQAAKVLADARNKAMKVDEAWLKTIGALNAEREKGFISEADYIATVQQLTAETYKKTGAHKAAGDAFAAERNAAKEWAKVMKEATDIREDAEGKTLGLTKAQQALVGYLESPAYATNSEEMRQLAVSALVAANNAELLGASHKRTAALVAEANNHYAKFISDLQRGVDSVETQIRAMQDEAQAAQMAAERHISLAEAIQLVTIARLREKQAAMDIPDATAYDAVQREIDARERLLGLIRSKATADANSEAARQQGDLWSKIADDAGQALSNALMDGGKDAGDYLKGYFRSLFGRELAAMFSSAIGGWGQSLGLMAASGRSNGAAAAWQMGSGGGIPQGNTLNTLYGAYNVAAGYLGFGGATAGAAAGTLGYANAVGAVGGDAIGALYAANNGWAGVAAGNSLGAAAAGEGVAAGSGAAAAGSSAATAIPVIGWIIAAFLASQAAYKGGATHDMITGAARYATPGGIIAGRTYNDFRNFGMSEKWATILSGEALVARLLGHKGSVSGFGIGSIQDGDFVQGTQAPIPFGANVLKGGADPFLQNLSSDIAAAVTLAASSFGGGLTNGLRVGAVTDRDRENEVAALLGYFGADNKLIAGTQTGSGAFGVGGPGKDASKIASADLSKWIGEQMPVLIIQGLQSSDLEDRFDTYFDGIAASTLTSEQATQYLSLAGAVQQLSDAFTPLGGAFAQFDTLSVKAVASTAEAAGGFDALANAADAYYQRYFTEAERTTIATDRVREVLSGLGLTMPSVTQGADSARQQWRALVDAQDLSTEAGRKAFTTLLGVAGAFDEVVTAADAAAQAAAEAAEKLAGPLADAITRFGTPQERQGSTFGKIAGDLQRDAGVSFSISQLMGASVADIEAFARGFIAVSTNSDAAKTAVLGAANALFDLKKEATDQRGSLELELLRAQGKELDAVNIERGAEIAQLAALEASLGVAAGTFTDLQKGIYAANDAAAALAKQQNLLAGLDSVVGDFLSPQELANYRAQRIQQTLAGAGINVGIDGILNSTRQDIRQLWDAVGLEGKEAILDAYTTWETLYEEQTRAQRDTLTKQIDGLKQLRGMADDFARFTKGLAFSDLSPLSAQDQLTAARSLFETTLAKARSGDTDAAGQLTSVARDYLDEAAGAFASGPAYSAIFQSVTGAIDQFGGFAAALDPQIEALEAQLTSLDSIGAALGANGAIYGVLTDIKTAVIEDPRTTGTAPKDRTYIDGPTGSSGGLSGARKGEQYIDVQRSWSAQGGDRQAAVLEDVNKTLGEVVKRLDAIAVSNDANASIAQQAIKANSEDLKSLKEPLNRLAGTAQSAAAKAAVMPPRR